MTEDGSLMAVDVQIEHGVIKAGSPRRLFKTNVIFQYDGGLQRLVYDISPDDQRILVKERAASASDPNAAPVTVVLNWTALLKK